MIRAPAARAARTWIGEEARVAAPARLHLGFLDLHAGLGRRFGGVGLAIDGAGTVVRVCPATRLTARGSGHERALSAAERVIAAFDLPHGCEIIVDEATPEHAGLGSGTQIALSVGTALARLAGLAPTARETATIVERGVRSGIGVGAFAMGGVLVDGGRGRSEEPPPIVARLDMPADWRILLILDPALQGLHGAREAAAFEGLRPFPSELAGELSRLVLMAVLPAVAERDLQGFGRAVTELQARLGDYFAPVQGGRFASPDVAQALAWFASEGVAGGGQSSWGPTGFAFFGSEAEGLVALERARGRFADTGLHFRLVAGRNRGADIDPP
jgi:beta-RFAP synthase